MVSSRPVTTSRRAGRVTNKTKLLVVRGSDKLDLSAAETIFWEDGAGSGEATKHQHVGAKGVESGELQEHHLQAALSSASLIHSNSSTKPASPTPHVRSQKAADAPSTAPGGSTAALNYHIPTPDATGLVQIADYAKLYPPNQFAEPNGYIRFSDTVEESSGGWGGLGYCMDDRDEEWLATFNSKAEGGSGENGSSDVKPETGAMGPPSSAGRPSRYKGKDKEKESSPPTPIFINEETFEYIMGVMEKHTEDSVPMLHTNIDLLPDFTSFEHLFASPIPPSFLPSFEPPRGLVPAKDLVRMARSIYTHWKERRIARGGKSVMPTLNYDETNDNDPYVCFRRRDIRATRKTRRTDNFSVEQMQKLQLEMRQAHILASMVLRRETEKLALYRADKAVWEAKWKLFETKRRWPSLGITREEEELITGRQTRESAMAAAGAVNGAMLGGRDALAAQRENIPAIRRRIPEKEREEKERRERSAIEAARIVERGMGLGAGGRSNAPEVLKERMLALRNRLEEELAKRRAADAEWDDATDSSYQPLPLSHALHAFRPITALDPQSAFAFARPGVQDEDGLPTRPPAFRLRRGRGGVVRLDRRQPVWPSSRGTAPKSPSGFADFLFPDTMCTKPSRRRPKSIDDDDEEEFESQQSQKYRRLNEAWRYDVDHGGALGIGMGISEDDDRVLIDDLDLKYSRNRITLLNDSDVDRLRPDVAQLDLAREALDTTPDVPPIPIFNRPQMVPPNPQMVAQLQQQQLLQQQQMEQFQRYQMIAQQQALAAQQQAALVAAQQRAGGAAGPTNGDAGAAAVNGVHANGRAPIKRPASAQNGTANGNGSMPAPPAPTRNSLSPTNSLHQSPQMMNGVVGNQQKALLQGNLANLDPAIQQRILAQRALQAQAAQAAAGNGGGVEDINSEELARLAAQAGYAGNIQGFIDARNRARLLSAAKQAQTQQQQQQQQLQAVAAAHAQAQAQAGNANGAAGTPGATYGSPQLPSGQLQLKLPAHAAARLGANTPAPQSQRA